MPAIWSWVTIDVGQAVRSEQLSDANPDRPADRVEHHRPPGRQLVERTGAHQVEQVGGLQHARARGDAVVARAGYRARGQHHMHSPGQRVVHFGRGDLVFHRYRHLQPLQLPAPPVHRHVQSLPAVYQRRRRQHSAKRRPALGQLHGVPALGQHPGRLHPGRAAADHQHRARGRSGPAVSSSSSSWPLLGSITQVMIGFLLSRTMQA